MTVSPRDADVIREAVGRLMMPDYEALAALDRLLARVHALERATERLANAVHSVWVVDTCPDQDIDGFTDAEVEAARLELQEAEAAARAVVLEGAARQEQTDGGNVNVASGTEQETQR